MPALRLSSLAVAALLLGACVTHVGAPPVRAPAPPALDYAIERDLAYAGHEAARADLYRPRAADARPAVVLVHGGGWVRGSREEMDGIAEAAAQRGYVVLNIGYRFAPAHPYPAAVDDVRAAVAWLRGRAVQLGVDPARVAVWGYSAGAHLAALVAVGDAPVAAGSRVQALVAGGIPADMRRAADSELVQRFMGGTLAQIGERYRAASPLPQVDADDPPAFLYHGTWDLIVRADYSRMMKAAYDAAGVPAELYLMHGLGHIAAFVFDDRAVDAALDFLDRQMPAAPAQPAASRSSWPQTQAP